MIIKNFEQNINKISYDICLVNGNVRSYIYKSFTLFCLKEVCIRKTVYYNFSIIENDLYILIKPIFYFNFNIIKVRET